MLAGCACGMCVPAADASRYALRKL